MNKKELEEYIKSLEQTNPQVIAILKRFVADFQGDNDPSLQEIRRLLNNASVSDIKELFQRNAGIKK